MKAHLANNEIIYNFAPMTGLLATKLSANKTNNRRDMKPIKKHPMTYPPLYTKLPFKNNSLIRMRKLRIE